MATFTVYKVNLDGSLSHRENLGQDELDAWMIAKHGKYATVSVTHDQSGKTVLYTDDGQWWDKVG